MKPDIKHYNADPNYLRGLIAKAGLTQRATARRIGVSERIMRSYLSNTDNKTYQKAPYAVQFALECLAHSSPLKPPQ